ncbi:MAG: 2-amino-4-hydroxy-6-hydroxymethyldihydropteridine diphosphokinase [Pseudomonadota bacterium]
MPQATNRNGPVCRYVIALGANLPLHGDEPPATLRAALRALQARGIAVCDTSRFFSCPAFPAGNGPDYTNAAAVLETTLTARALLDALHAVEAQFGRERATRWGQRTLDLDLITAGEGVFPDRATHAEWRLLDAATQRLRAPDEMILPHPRLQDRAFVLVPMADIAPDWRHPVLGKTVVEMRDALPPEALAEMVPMVTVD